MNNKIIYGNIFSRFYQCIRRKLAIAKARYYDKKLGIECIKRDTYSTTFYGRLEKMVKYLKLKERDVFVDLGCGEGRVVFFVALQKLEKVIGVEISKEIIDIARKNLKNLRLCNSPIEFVYSDATKYDLQEGTVFFMFNPFDAITLEKVLNNLRNSVTENPREIHIVYYVPAHHELLDRQDWLVREGEIENKDCLVWRNRFKE
jgi:SAM-dependent methyltransferase